MPYQLYPAQKHEGLPLQHSTGSPCIWQRKYADIVFKSVLRE